MHTHMYIHAYREHICLQTTEKRAKHKHCLTVNIHPSEINERSEANDLLQS